MSLHANAPAPMKNEKGERLADSRTTPPIIVADPGSLRPVKKPAEREAFEAAAQSTRRRLSAARPTKPTTPLERSRSDPGSGTSRMTLFV